MVSGEKQSPADAKVESPAQGDGHKPDPKETTEAPEAPKQTQEPQSQPDQAGDEGDDGLSELDKQGGLVLEVPGDEEEDQSKDDDGDSLGPEDQEAKKQYQEDIKRNPWLKFKQLVPLTPS